MNLRRKRRRLIAAILMLAIGLMMSPGCEAEIKPYGDEEEVWAILSELCDNDKIAAGVMGFFYRESRLKADAVAGWDVRDEGICERFAKEAKGMAKEEFIERVQAFGGYGLGQWLSHDYLSAFYDFMQGNITDVRMQCEFAVESMMQNEGLWQELLNCSTAIQCGRRIGLLYDGTTTEGAEAIAAFADYYYRRMFADGKS